MLLELEPLLGQLTLHPLIDPRVRTMEQFGCPVDFVTTIFSIPQAGGIAAAPSRTLELRARTVDDWAPIVSCLVEHQALSGRVTRVEHDLVTIWQSMTIPTDLFQQTPMAELFEARVHEEQTVDESGMTKATTTIAVEFPDGEIAPV